MKLSTAYTTRQASDYNRIRFESDGGRWAHAIEIEMSGYVRTLLPPKAKILDVGCGTGRLLLEWRKMGFEVYGIDSSRPMLDILKNENSVMENISHGDAGALPYPDNTFDYVYAVRVLNLLASVDHALQSLREMIRVCKPGGYVCADILNPNRLIRYLWMGKRIITVPRDDVLRATSGSDLIHHGYGFFFTLSAAPRLPGWLRSLDEQAVKRCGKLANREYLFFEKRDGCTE